MVARQVVKAILIALIHHHLLLICRMMRTAEEVEEAVGAVKQEEALDRVVVHIRAAQSAHHRRQYLVE
jgi:hypothetical protein